MVTTSRQKAPADPPIRSRSILLASTSLGTFLVILLTSGLNIMSPKIREDFSGAAGSISWLISGYTLAFAMLSLTGGSLADRFGAHKTFVVGIAVFAVFATVSAISPSLGVVILGSFGQGAGAALVLPASLSLIQHVYREDRKRLASAIGIWAGSNALGAAVGPVLCGALVSAYSWRTAFIVVAVTAAVCGVVGCIVFPRIRPSSHPIDVPGTAVIIVLLGLVATLAHQAAVLPWPLLVVGVGVVVALTLLFVKVERRTAAPLLPLEQLRDTAFSGNALVSIIGTAAFFGPLYLVSTGFQDVLGMTAFESGVALLPLAGGNLLAALVSGRVQLRLGVRQVMILGSVLLILGLLPLLVSFSDYPGTVPSLVLLGIGWGLLVPSTSAAGLARAHRGKEGVASAVTAGGRELGAALAAAVLLPLGVNAGIGASVAVGVLSLAIVLLAVRKLESPLRARRSGGDDETRD